MRITKKQLEYYVDLYNGISDYQVKLDCACGGYKLISYDGRYEITPYRMTCRECYYVILGMFNVEVRKMEKRYRNA